MTRPCRRLFPPWLAARLALAVALFLALAPSVVHSQPLSSCSGAGTGTGAMGGTSRNTTGTGMMGGASRNSTGTGMESGSGPRSFPSNSPMFPPNAPPGGYGREGFRHDRPGQTPMDQLLPRESLAGLSYVTETQLEYAKRLMYATDRSLALSRIASAATFSAQLDLAERALNDATTAALELEPGMVRDQRITSIVQALMGLAEARLRDSSNPVPLATEQPANPEPPARTDPAPPPPPAPGAAPPPVVAIPTTPPYAAAPGTTPPVVAPPLPVAERPDVIRKATADWKRAGILAEQIVNPTYQNELMYRVADSMATGSQNIINTFPKLDGGTVKSAEGVNRSYSGLPDQLLQDATTLVLKIKRPVWRDRCCGRDRGGTGR
jgi:hypothetical protein